MPNLLHVQCCEIAKDIRWIIHQHNYVTFYVRFVVCLKENPLYFFPKN